MMNLLVTGGCGFIGSNFIEMVLKSKREHINKIINLDALTYAGSLENTDTFSSDEKYIFEKVNLCDTDEVWRVFRENDVTHVVHLAAESHVDNSITAQEYLWTAMCLVLIIFSKYLKRAT